MVSAYTLGVAYRVQSYKTLIGFISTQRLYILWKLFANQVMLMRVLFSREISVTTSNQNVNVPDIPTLNHDIALKAFSPNWH